MVKNVDSRFGLLTRALRIPFLSASILPFLFGSFLNVGHFNFLALALGLISVMATHLGANLINDYADSKSGVDSQDRNFYGFFGGSKLIQEGILSEGFYFRLAVLCFLLAYASVLALSFTLGNFLAVFYYIFVLFLGWSYSQKPFKFAYRRLGEFVIFLLFGPALVMGGYFIQTGIFPDLRSFLVSLPSGLLTTAILFANEVPDYNDDIRCSKMNWVSLVGPKNAYLVYIFIMLCAFISIAASIAMRFLSLSSVFSLFFILFVFKAAIILKKDYADKLKLIKSSRLTILADTFVCVILIITRFIR